MNNTLVLPLFGHAEFSEYWQIAGTGANVLNTILPDSPRWCKRARLKVRSYGATIVFAGSGSAGITVLGDMSSNTAVREGEAAEIFQDPSDATSYLMIKTARSL